MVSLVYGHVVCILCPDGHESEPNLCGEINSTDTFQFVEEEISTPQIETVDHHDDASVAAALAVVNDVGSRHHLDVSVPHIFTRGCVSAMLRVYKYRYRVKE